MCSIFMMNQLILYFKKSPPFLIPQLVFVYVTAEYETKLNSLNQIVLWDYIIEDIEVLSHFTRD